VTVVDYGLGNLFSVARALESQGARVGFAADPDAVRSAERLVLPGVGAFGDGMAGLASRGLVEPIREFARSGRPLFGICLGTQLLMDEGREFGTHPGLGLVPGSVGPFDEQRGERVDKIPHVGWNAIRPTATRRWQGTFLSETAPGTAMYFTHSFVIRPANDADVVAVADYAGGEVCAVLRHGNVSGCQFHPEKSGPAGLALLGRVVAGS
jgi:imidazole glycerol-phosphate synthase subunit HisH